MLSGLELASEKAGIIDRTKQNIALLRVLINVKSYWDNFLKTSDVGEREKVFECLEAELLSMDKCPDFVVNRGHYFGTDQFPEEPALNDADKEALISFLKTF